MADLSPLRLYIAAPWIHKDAARAVREEFVAAGFEITSRWLDFEGGGYDASNETLAEEAAKDIQDILNSQGMVVLQYSKSEGKAFEQGLFLAATQFTGVNNKMVLVAPDGKRGNVFQYLDDAYTLVPDVAAAIEECKKFPGYIQVGEIVQDESVESATAVTETPGGSHPSGVELRETSGDTSAARAERPDRSGE